jgi:hypothetical protein
MPKQAGGTRRRTLVSLLTLAALVAALHVWLTGSVLDEMAGLKADAPRIERMQAEYVSEVRLTRPPVAAALTPAPPAAPIAPQAGRRKKPKPPPEAASAASAPQAAQAASAASPPLAASADDNTRPALAAAAPPTASQADAPGAASAPSAALESAPSRGTAAQDPDRFIWPLATRVSYIMEGHYRGPVHGQSSVEWIRQEQRYQVHIDASVGPSFAPLGSWRLSSEGEIRAEGLYPRRYENVNRLLIRSARSRVMELGDEQVQLPDGKLQPRTTGLQDPASFMIQVAYQFILDPSKARPGSSFEMTVLTLRKPEPLVFDVIEEVQLDTPMGRIPTLHVRPRKAVADDGALPADVWFAPGLQYLPVRITMRMKDDTWLEMKLSRPPQQTPGQPTSAAAASSRPASAP